MRFILRQFPKKIFEKIDLNWLRFLAYRNFMADNNFIIKQFWRKEYPYGKNYLATIFVAQSTDTPKNGVYANANCVDLYDGYRCDCKYGFEANGKSVETNDDLCTEIPQVNECDKKKLNTCHKNAICTDTLNSYTCACMEGFTDTDTANPGRSCVPCCQEGVSSFWFDFTNFSNFGQKKFFWQKFIFWHKCRF